MKKKVTILYVLTFLIFLAGCTGCNSNQTPKVAILQDKPQEWADALKLGFSDGISEQGYEIGKDVILIPRSANGDPQAFSTLVETFAKSKYDIIYTLGTQASQDVFSKTKEKNIIFGAVTDPVKAGLYKDNLSTPLANITGTQDLWPYPAQVDLIKSLIPGIKKIGILYNSSEVNSQVSVELIKKECTRTGIQLEQRTVTQESEVITAVNALLNAGIELLFIPADNTAQTSAPVIIAECNRKKIPVFTGISGIVESGAIATVGTNYYELGKVNAKQAVQILFKKKKAKEVPVAIADKGDIYINLKVAKSLNINVPDSLIKKAFKTYK